MKKIAVNVRCLNHQLTGVQRYTGEVMAHGLDTIAEPIAPKKGLGQIGDHFWEQVVLPLQLKGRLLWSPANIGPLSYTHQVVTMHDMNVFDFPQYYGSKKFVIWYQYLFKHLAHRAHCIITDSCYSAQRLLDIIKIPEDRVRVVYLGVDKRFSSISQNQMSEILTPLGLSGKRYILSVASISPNKNIQRLIEAWKLIFSQLPEDVWLILAGGIPPLAPHMDLARLPPRVKLLGYVDDKVLPALYSGAMAFVFVSLNEGFGLPAVEAMACGTPVIVSNVCALPEIVGNAGIKVDPYSVEAIGSALLEMIINESMRYEYAQLGLTKSKQFDWHITATEVEKILRRFM